MNILDQLKEDILRKKETTGSNDIVVIFTQEDERRILQELSGKIHGEVLRDRLPFRGYLFGCPYARYDDEVAYCPESHLLFFQYQEPGSAIKSATTMMVKQRDKGLLKYGVSIEDANLDAAALIRHAREEAADLNVYLAQLEEACKQMQRNVREALVEELAAMPLTGEARAALSVFRDSSAVAITMYVQPSELEQWNRTGRNLLTISRSNDFPFTIPLTLVMK